MNWIEKTLKEYDELLGKTRADEDFGEITHDFWTKKLLESYKNGAQAERRKASKKPEASENR